MTDVIYEQPVGDGRHMLVLMVSRGGMVIRMNWREYLSITLSCRQAESLAELLLAAADAAREDGR
jgi:hypothetical protein